MPAARPERDGVGTVVGPGAQAPPSAGPHRPSVPWLAHRGPAGVDGIAAIQVFPGDWSLGYLGVAPAARRQGVGTALATAVLAAAHAAGTTKVTASVAVANDPIRGTLEAVGFTVRSLRTDFVRRLGG